MNNYGQTILNELADRFQAMDYTSERISKTVLTKTAPWGAVSTHTWMKEEETLFQQQIPHISCSLIRCKLDGTQYELHINEQTTTFVITVELPNPEKTNAQYAHCYLSQGDLDETKLPLDSLLLSLSEWVQHLPENRLRFATGQWIMEHS